jgi:L-alanine-DL-glutamate epimerase-like enolase superfamily enzyme
MQSPNTSLLSTPIERIDVYRVAVPLPEPLQLFPGTVITEREFVIARAYAGGHYGTGFGLTRGAAVDRIAIERIVPFTVNQPIGAIRHIWNKVRYSVRFFGENGYFARAFSVVDIALWDLLGKTLNVPLWRLWGGNSAEIPCMAIAGYYRAGDTIRLLRQEAERLAAAGYTWLKVPVGDDPDLDQKRFRTLREVMGPEVMLGVDAHGGFNSIKDALQMWRAIEPFNIAFLEDPFPPAAWELSVQFAQTTQVKIAYGENIALPSILQRLGSPSGIDIVRPDATYLLGITGYIQAISTALENNVSVFPHYFPDVHAPLAGAFGAAWIEESPPESDTVNFQVLRAEQPVIRNGVWHLTEKPGLGIEWDEDALAKFRVP